jgi:hypothetical protein
VWQEPSTYHILEEIISTYQEHEITSLLKSCFSANHLEVKRKNTIFAVYSDKNPFTGGGRVGRKAL